jgi:hypothetical protein
VNSVSHNIEETEGAVLLGDLSLLLDPHQIDVVTVLAVYYYTVILVILQTA